MKAQDHAELDALRMVVVDVLADAPLDDIANRLDSRHRIRIPKKRFSVPRTIRENFYLDVMRILAVS